MNKDKSTYWNKTSSITAMKNKRHPKRFKSKNSLTRQRFVFTVVVLIIFALCLAINFRSFSEMLQQSSENTKLKAEIDRLTNENTVLQEEIWNLGNDPFTIEREARKIGMSRPDEKILVPVY